MPIPTPARTPDGGHALSVWELHEALGRLVDQGHGAVVCVTSEPDGRPVLLTSVELVTGDEPMAVHIR